MLKSSVKVPKYVAVSEQAIGTFIEENESWIGLLGLFR